MRGVSVLCQDVKVPEKYHSLEPTKPINAAGSVPNNMELEDPVLTESPSNTGGAKSSWDLIDLAPRRSNTIALSNIEPKEQSIDKTIGCSDSATSNAELPKPAPQPSTEPPELGATQDEPTIRTKAERQKKCQREAR
ncbi:hypothetical protein NDU88_008495 [Pleurodeles waltl]|uniref:Prolactin receptor n=1 Tax=Pleurodeles waltl TaxID=8319 RepID=A0AAV7N554_PLEWA|nr:hypothetical protein NDU88_008495 [Pleurodeles waltl]